MIAKVGQSLLGHPDGLETLLKFRPTHDERYDDSRFNFVRKVLGRAGPPLLPALHAALQSDDRVIRSNAARGCGAIHDPSSIDPLIKALDLESGLSRASIVWALGELKAKSALPTLTRLYVNARKDEQGSHAGYGAGFLAGQGGAAAADQFNRIRSLAAIGAEWNDLTATAAGPAVDPRHQEALLSANDILKAVTKIGAADAQEFYRMLAAESDHRDRRAAAKQLAVKKEEDRKLNIPILNGMLTDSHPEVSLAAAVSLLILGQVAGQQPVLDGLKSESWGHALHELERLEKSQRSFARNEIEAIANDPGKSDEIRQYARHLIGTDR